MMETAQTARERPRERLRQLVFRDLRAGGNVADLHRPWPEPWPDPETWPESEDCDMLGHMGVKLRFEIRIVRGPGAGQPRIWDPASRHQVLIGRSASADLRLDHPTVSERHALVREQDGVWWIEDLGSANGTLLNERPLVPGQSAICKPGDVLIVGPFLLGVLDLGLEEVTADGASTQSLALGLVAHLLDSGQAGHMPRLVATDGLSHSVPLPLGRPVVLGRDPGCHLTIPGEDVSRRHAKVYVDRDGCWLADLNSKNGTSVDGRRIRGLWELHSGQKIEIGGVTFVFEDPAEEMLAELEGAAHEIVAHEGALVSESAMVSSRPESEPAHVEAEQEPADHPGLEGSQSIQSAMAKSADLSVDQIGQNGDEDEEVGGIVWIVGLVLGVLAVAGAGLALYLVVSGP